MKLIGAGYSEPKILRDMFDEFNKYKIQGHFFFMVTQRLTEVCTAPKNQYGIFLVYALRKGRVELVYVGKSGFADIDGKEGKSKSSKENTNDLLESILNEHQFGDIERKNSWPVQMMIEDIEALHVHWYVTVDKKDHDLPAYMKTKAMQIYKSIYGKLPRWNNQS